MINYDLARARGLSKETISEIEEKHAYRELLGELYASGKVVKDVYLEQWTNNEYALQDLWGFDRDAKYHRFWEMKGCICPKMDNTDAYPTGYYVRVMSCPLHGYGNEDKSI